MKRTLLIFLLTQIANISFCLASSNKDTSANHSANRNYYDNKIDAIQSKIDNNQKDANANILSAKQDIKDLLNGYIIAFGSVFALVGFSINFFGRKAIRNRVEEIIAQTTKDHVDTAIYNVLNS